MVRLAPGRPFYTRHLRVERETGRFFSSVPKDKMKQFAKFREGMLLVAGITLAAVVHSEGRPAPGYADISVPAVSVDFDEGLDVRDARNRPVRHAAAIRQMRQLFVSSAYSLLMRCQAPRVAQVLGVLDSLWNASNGFLQRAIHGMSRAVETLWAPAAKRSLPVLILLAFAAALLLAPLFRTDFSCCRISSLLSLVSSVVLRC